MGFHMFATDIVRLTAFNPALIYAFEYEGDPDHPDSGEVLVGQYTDILNAYLYAQDTILPIVREKGFAQVPARTLLDWIRGLQALNSTTILTSQRMSPGVFRDASVYLWNAGPEFYKMLCISLSTPRSQWASEDAIEGRVALFSALFSIAPEKTRALFLLLKKIDEDSSIQLFPSQVAFLARYEKKSIQAFSLLEKLNAAYHQDYLSERERRLIQDFMLVGVPAESIEHDMMALASETLSGYVACDKSNLDEVTGFLARVFSRFINIHPFPNANGRTATCLLNILLRSFDLPSIVLRFPGEANCPSSEYAQAIVYLNQSQEPLKALIKKRIIAEIASPFKDELLAETICLRMTLNETIGRIKAEDTKSKINDLLRRDVPLPLSDSQVEQRDTLLIAIRVAQAEEKRLQRVKKIKCDLHCLSGVPGWKEKNSIYWLETTESEAKRIGPMLPVRLKSELVISPIKGNAAVWVVKYQQFDETVLADRASQRLASAGIGHHSAHGLFAAAGTGVGGAVSHPSAHLGLRGV